MHSPIRGAALLAGLAAALLQTPGHACSTCKCGDYTISLFGTEKPFESRFRVGIDYLYRSETQGDPALLARQTDEQRLLLGLSYALTDDLSVALQAPFVRKQIRDGNLARQQAEGFGDVDLVGRFTLLREGGVSGRHLAGLRVGVRLPTTEQVRDGNGDRLDIDVQPDAGSTVPNLGGWYAYFRYPWFVTTTLTAFSFGDGNQDFSPGDAVVASALAQYGLTQSFALQAGIDARYAERNRFSGVEDPDSGGTLAMVFGGIALRMADELVLSAGAQVPVLDDLNGHQEEDPVVRVGLAYDF
ncbi:hypothetical protein [Sinimarinibacterium thermocellulolyticum]|uniref:Transporter n=1 Tax=Sinimarinibacterium thermocellulolyticum TaxID=3170016 RepID=A0ABV2ACG0_9GAMM